MNKQPLLLLVLALAGLVPGLCAADTPPGTPVPVRLRRKGFAVASLLWMASWPTASPVPSA